jgi:hypothetical protein
MLIVLVILAVVAAGLTLFSLLRGLTAFSKEQTTESYNKQTQMMFARVKWQAIAVLLVVIAAAFFSN